MLGLAGVGVGIGMGLSSQSAKTDAENLRRATPGLCAPPGGAACDAYDAKRGDAKDAATISTIGYIGGGVLLAGALATVALWPKHTERASKVKPRVVPVMGSGTAGLSMIGTF